MPQTEPTIANYDAQTADEITQRLRKLSQADLATLEAYEKRGQARSTVLERIAALRGDMPWPGYDDMEVEEVNAALKQRDGDAASRVLDYERRHKGRTTIIEFAERQRTASGESPRAVPKPRASAKNGSKARTKKTSRPKPAASSQRRSAKSSARTTGGRTSTAAPTRTRSKPASRPSTTRSSGQRSKRSQGTSGTRSKSSTASRSRTRARSSSATQSSRSGSRGKRTTRQTAPSGIKQRVTGALQSAENRTEKLARGTRDAVGSAAQESRHAVATAAKDTGHAVGAAANKAKGPALIGGAVLAAVGGAVALGRAPKLQLRKRKRLLGVPIPSRTAYGIAAKRVGQALDSAGSTGHQIGQWSDGLQELRQRIAGEKGSAAKPTES
jgi:hypothetical protein